MCTCTHVSLYGLRQFSVISSLQTGIIAAAGPGMRTAPSRTRRCSCSAAALLCKMRTIVRKFIFAVLCAQGFFIQSSVNNIQSPFLLGRRLYT